MRHQDTETTHRTGKFLMFAGSALCLAALILTVRESNVLDQAEYMLNQSQNGLAPHFDCTAIECPWNDAAHRITDRIEDISRTRTFLPSRRPPPPIFEEFNPFDQPPWFADNF